jgi:hypothetical protein
LVKVRAIVNVDQYQFHLVIFDSFYLSNDEFIRVSSISVGTLASVESAPAAAAPAASFASLVGSGAAGASFFSVFSGLCAVLCAV